MIGLEYILDVYGIQKKELAEQLGIKKQNITLWLSGKQNISKKYLPILSEKFRIPIEYFQKELTDIDKRKIDLRRIQTELNDTAAEYDEEVLDEETGEMIKVHRTDYNSGLLDLYHLKEMDLKEEKVLKKIRVAISDFPETDSMDEYIELYEEGITIFERFTKIVKEVEDKREMSYFLSAMEQFYDCDANQKQSLLCKAEKYLPEAITEKLSFAEALCAVTILYKSREEEFWGDYQE